MQRKLIKRDRLFYDQFEWVLSFRVKSACLARKLSHPDLDHWINRRQSLDTRWGFTKDAITSWDRDNLHSLVDLLLTVPQPRKFYFTMHWAYVYHNDTQELERIAQAPYLGQLCLGQAAVVRPRDVIVKRKPQYGYRTYFRERLFKDMEKGRNFRDFLRRQDQLSCSGALERSLENEKYFYLQRHHYVEHDSPQDALLLNLHTPNIVRKTVPVQAK